MFTQAMLNVSINATAIPGSIAHFLGDSFTEQVANFVPPTNQQRDKEVPVGWPIGVSVGSLLVVGAAVWLGFYVFHQRRRNMLQQVGREAGGLDVQLSSCNIEVSTDVS